jgi:hypothetical protein
MAILIGWGEERTATLDDMRFVVVAAVGAVSLALLGAAWALGGSDVQTQKGAAAAPRCAQLGGWQRLANRIDALVYCPSWMPDPLVPQIGNRWNNIDSVDPDRSYLQSFVWQEAAGLNTQEIHVILRGYPGKTAIPRTCQDVTTVNGKTYRKKIPCFEDPRGTWRSTNGITARMYTVNHGADSWHVLFAWKRDGSLYTISEHVAPPLSFSKVVANLKRMIDGLVLVRPA